MTLNDPQAASARQTLNKLPAEPWRDVWSVLRAFPDDRSCVSYLFALRKGERAPCPRCAKQAEWSLLSRRAPHFSKCCNAKLDIRVDTIFERSSLPLNIWFYVIFLVLNRSRATSPDFLSRHVDISVGAAWLILRAIRLQLHATLIQERTRLPGGPALLEEFLFRPVKTSRLPGSGSARVLVVTRAGLIFPSVVQTADAKRYGPILAEHRECEGSMVTCDARMFAHLARHHPASEVALQTPASLLGNEAFFTNFSNSAGFKAHFYRSMGQRTPVDRKHLDLYLAEAAWRFNFCARERSPTARFFASLPLLSPAPHP